MKKQVIAAPKGNEGDKNVPPIDMNTIFKRFEADGFDRAYMISNVLPEWWCEEVSETPSGFAETVMWIARHFGVKPKAIYDDRLPDAATLLRSSTRFLREAGVHDEGDER